MKRDLSDLNAEQSRVFLDYFNAKLREKHGLPFGTEGEGRLVDSVYEADLSDWLSTTRESLSREEVTTDAFRGVKSRPDRA